MTFVLFSIFYFSILPGQSNTETSEPCKNSVTASLQIGEHTTSRLKLGYSTEYYSDFTSRCLDNNTLSQVFVTDSGEFELDCCSDTDFIELSYDLSIKSALYSCRYVINLDRCIPGCIGLDLDNDGICGEDDCWPDNATLSFGPGDSCDDGNPFTVDDSYNSNC